MQHLGAMRLSIKARGLLVCLLCCATQGRSQTLSTTSTMPDAAVGTQLNTHVAPPPIDVGSQGEVKQATFAMGCFWCPDYTFGCVLGVVRTRVGYAGGNKEGPSYYDLGDHIEMIQIDYDPQQVSYEQLLQIFWEHHEPHRRSYQRQYACAVVCHDEHQNRLARISKQRIAERYAAPIHTQVLPATRFYLAENYHQKYELRQHRSLLREFEAMYPNEADLVNSTAAARVNAFLSGNGDIKLLQSEIGSYGLSQAGRQRLLELAQQRLKPAN